MCTVSRIPTLYKKLIAKLRFYLLPKNHKQTMNVPGRYVISNNGTTTERIFSFLDLHLKNIIPKIPHILEDTRDFL